MYMYKYVLMAVCASSWLDSGEHFYILLNLWHFADTLELLCNNVSCDSKFFNQVYKYLFIFSYVPPVKRIMICISNRCITIIIIIIARVHWICCLCIIIVTSTNEQITFWTVWIVFCWRSQYVIAIIVSAFEWQNLLCWHFGRS